MELAARRLGILMIALSVRDIVMTATDHLRAPNHDGLAAKPWLELAGGIHSALRAA